MSGGEWAGAHAVLWPLPHHPQPLCQVRSSAEASKRAFLERKGLTAAEIEEAFQRVPQEPAAPAAAPAPAPSAALQTTLQHIQPSPQPQYVYVQQPVAPAQQAAPPAPPQPVRWTQAVLGAGFLAAGAYAVKTLVWPYLHDAYAGWRGAVPAPLRPAAGEEDGGAAAAAAAAAAEATKAVAEAIAAQTSELRSSIASMRELVAGLEGGRAAVMAAEGEGVAALREELRSVSAALSE